MLVLKLPKLTRHWNKSGLQYIEYPVTWFLEVPELPDSKNSDPIVDHFVHCNINMLEQNSTCSGCGPPENYRKRGSASYIVRQWLLWESERERERDACDVIDITLKSRVIMHMITSTARRPNASTRSEPVERSNFEVHDKELGAWALDWAAGSTDWWTTMGKWKLCVRWSDCRLSPSSISLACFKQEE